MERPVELAVGRRLAQPGSTARWLALEQPALQVRVAPVGSLVDQLHEQLGVGRGALHEQRGADRPGERGVGGERARSGSRARRDLRPSSTADRRRRRPGTTTPGASSPRRTVGRRLDRRRRGRRERAVAAQVPALPRRVGEREVARVDPSVRHEHDQPRRGASRSSVVTERLVLLQGPEPSVDAAPHWSSHARRSSRILGAGDAGSSRCCGRRW